MENKDVEKTEEKKPKSFITFLLNIWLTILHWLGLRTVKEHNDVCAALRTIYEGQITEYKRLTTELRELANSYLEKSDMYETMYTNQQTVVNDDIAKIHELEENYDNLKKDYSKTCDDYHDLRVENTELRATLSRYKTAGDYNLKFVKDTQKLLEREIKPSDEFSFPRSQPWPGSMTITDDIANMDNGDKKVIVRGRCIAMDDTTTQINNEPDMYGKIMKMVDQMKRYGTLDRVAYQMITSGAMTLTLAYNEDCTNYVLYYEMAADAPESQCKLEKMVQGVDTDPENE